MAEISTPPALPQRLPPPTGDEIEVLRTSKVDAARAYRNRTGAGIREALDVLTPYMIWVKCPKCKGFGKIRVPPPEA